MNILDLKAEDKLIYLLVMQPNKCFYQIASKLKPEMFSSDINRGILRKCLRFVEEEKPVSIDTFCIRSDTEMILHISSLTTAYGHMDAQNVSIDYLIELVVEEYRKKELGVMNINVQRMRETGSSYNEIMDYIENEKDAMNIDLTTGIVSMEELVDTFGTPEALNKLDQASIKTGYSTFDRHVKIKNGDFLILAGRPGMGKTDVALFFAKSIAQQGMPVGIISLEMREEYLMKRLIRHTDARSLSELPIYIDQARSHSLESLGAKALKMVKTYNIGILIIDYLTLIDPPKAENRNQQVTEMSRKLKLMAGKLNIPFLILAQLNREVEKRRDKRPVLSDLRDSGSIEQDADAVMFLYRPIVYDIKELEKISDTTNYLEMIVSKNREGAIGSIDFYYDVESKKFGEWNNTTSCPINHVPF